MATDETTRIDLNGVFTAAEMEDILRDLANARAVLKPEVPAKPPMQGDVLVQEEALFTIRTLAGGGLRIWLRNEGFGWLAFALTPSARQELFEFLGKKPGHTLTTH